MHLRSCFFLLFLLPLLLTAPDRRACSVFQQEWGEETLVGKNYDWSIGDGLLVVNRRGLAKTAFPTRSHQLAHWTSRYGSVTFNQFGSEFPNGGLNEAGLVVEVLWLEGTEYPNPDQRPALNVLQWVQYQLDTAASVQEVIANQSAVRIESEIPLHYLVADASGAVATFEFLDGQAVVHGGDHLPVAALTNSTYDSSLRYLEQLRESGQSAPSDDSSKARFARAVERLREPGRAHPIDWTFSTLATVDQPSTRWSIVYELDSRKLHFRTRELSLTRSLTLTDIDFSCDRPTRLLDLQADLEGDVFASLESFSSLVNYDLIRRSFGKIDFLADTPPAELRRIAQYPESTRCEVP